MEFSLAFQYLQQPRREQQNIARQLDRTDDNGCLSLGAHRRQRSSDSVDVEVSIRRMGRAMHMQ